ncbi:Ni/Fe hydrogenase subunit alpha [Candidatus Falkowbacteria bacterium]|nr:Ni/Fe hydrogenase subunit alpha [Candidatus Falkowbacteria bacterium]
MKTIKINHIAKTEGHFSFVGALVGRDFASARLETEEGARLIEGILLGRKYHEAPVVTSRICGICPIVHNLTSCKSLEMALNIKVNNEIKLLRKMLINAQWIHSHSLHAFFLSFPDVVGISNNFDFLKKYPTQSKLALDVRDFGVQLSKIIGGRTVHPINSVVGGFNVVPDKNELFNLMEKSEEIIAKAEKMFNFVIQNKLPKFENPANYTTLKSKDEYAVYDGKVYFFDSKESISADKFLYDMEEHLLPYEKVKRVMHNERVVLVGALARINNNFDQLNPRAKKAWQKLKIELPCFNPFYNIWAQVVEIIHNLEEVQTLYTKFQKIKSPKVKIPFKVKAGKGFAVMEAPRGILYHEYELNDQGTIIHTNIISPTTIFLGQMEKDLEKFLLKHQRTSDKKREQLIKTLIRAYDPCISCATH